METLDYGMDIKRTAPIAVFNPLPWQIAPWRDKSKIVLLEGGAGGGKSKLAAEKLHAFCLKYPGATALMVRHTRESMLNSNVLMFERDILGGDTSVIHRPSAHRFEYPNGSIVAYGGMKDQQQREQVRSIGTKGGVDFIWMEEATAFEEADFNELLSRLRGRAAPWVQILLTTNPDTPMHWIYRLLIAGGRANVYRSMAADNVYNPTSYLETLETLTGPEGQRLGQGLWTRAEGLVYSKWCSDNITKFAEYVPGGGPVYWGGDDGYTGSIDPVTGTFTAGSHPRVILFAQHRHDGTLCIFDECYQIGTEPGETIEEVKKWPSEDKPYPKPVHVACDKSARAMHLALHKRDYRTRNGPSSLEESIKVMRGWVSPDKRGKRILLVHPRCRHFCLEMAAYSLDKDGGKPMKEFDHGPDAARYLIWTLRYQDMRED